jgi:type I restriction enzyme S subunit
LKELAEKITKGTTPTTYGYVYKSEGVLFVKAESLEELKINKAACAFVDEAAHNAFKRSQLEPKDILFTIAGTLGRTAIVGSADIPANTNQAVALIRLKNLELVEYVARFLSHCGLGDQLGRGTGLQNLNLQQVADVEVPIPPPVERRALLKKVDTLLSCSTSARNELAKVPKLVERYKQAVLSAAFRGDLTAKWRSSRKNSTFERSGNERKKQALSARWIPDIKIPDSWSFVSVDELATKVQYGSSSKTSDQVIDGVPVMRMGNLVNGSLSFDKLKYLPSTHREFPDLLLENGDLLFNRTNSAELVGKTAVFRKSGREVSFASYLIRIQLEDYIPELLSAYVNSPYGTVIRR